MILSLRQLCADIGPLLSLQDINLNVEAGSVSVIIGPNGAGKTSLLRLVCGDMQSSSGEVLLNGRPVSSWPVEQRATILSVLPQRSSIEFPFTVEEVVRMGRIPHNSGFRRDSEIISGALALVDCAHLAQRFYINLSGGEKQRVQLARVAAQIWDSSELGGRCLVLDEPSASLDMAHQEVIVNMLRFFTKQGAGVLMVLHDLNLAAKNADQLLLIDKGRCVKSGSLEQVLQEDVLSSVFMIPTHVSTNPLTGKPLVVT